MWFKWTNRIIEKIQILGNLKIYELLQQQKIILLLMLTLKNSDICNTGKLVIEAPKSQIRNCKTGGKIVWNSFNFKFNYIINPLQKTDARTDIHSYRQRVQKYLFIIFWKDLVISSKTVFELKTTTYIHIFLKRN